MPIPIPPCPPAAVPARTRVVSRRSRRHRHGVHRLADLSAFEIVDRSVDVRVGELLLDLSPALFELVDRNRTEAPFGDVLPDAPLDLLELLFDTRPEPLRLARAGDIGRRRTAAVRVRRRVAPTAHTARERDDDGANDPPTHRG